MIKITIELHRWGNPNDKKTLATATISNDATGTRSRGNYTYKLAKASGNIWKSGKIEDFPRKSRSVWRLLYLVLKDVYK